MGEDPVLSVGGEGLCVGRVGAGGFDLGGEGLVEEELTDVGNGRASESVVWKDAGGC